MKAVLFGLMALALSYNASASIVVIVDGKTYSCTEGSGDGSSAGCRDKAAKIEKKYAACVDSYGTGQKAYCFGQVVQTAIDKTCGEVSDTCNSKCVDAYGAGQKSYCYSQCF